MKRLFNASELAIVRTLGLSSAVTVGLFIVRVFYFDSLRYSFMVWNLFLAWLPVLLAWWLLRRLKTSSWKSVGNLLLTLVWLILLPNSFYLISDFIHLYTTSRTALLFDVVLLTSFAFNGLVLGFLSLYNVHSQLRRRVDNLDANALVGFVLLACSFAIYLGRHLRWNSWDLFLAPAGILFDVSDRILHPIIHLQTTTTTLLFFVLLSSMYAVIWNLLKVLPGSNTHK